MAEEIEEQIQEWVEKRLLFPDIIGIGECLVETKHDLENLSENNIPPWMNVIEYKESLKAEIMKLEKLYNYAIDYSIKVVL